MLWKQPKTQIPKQCDICHAPIGLYQPWYSVLINSHFARPRVKDSLSVLCPDCFSAYKHFLVEQEFRSIHKREINESMHPND